jgi:hypothetical protein
MSILLDLIKPFAGYIIIAVVAGFGFLYMKQHYYDQGWYAAMHAVALQDQKAKETGEEARHDVENCRDSGRHWNISSGLCEH